MIVTIGQFQVRKVAVQTSCSQPPFQNRNNQQSHTIRTSARSARQAMDPRFFPSLLS